MKELGYLFAKIKYKIKHGDKESVNNFFRNAGVKIGENCTICCNILSSEPYLIEIGNDVTISGNVLFVTHDNSVAKFFGGGYDLYGRITVGNHCFIGQNSTIMYGVTLADNVIVGSGSVVTKSVTESNVIIAGNPAKIVGSWENFLKRANNNAIYTKGFSAEEKKKKVLESEHKFVRR